MTGEPRPKAKPLRAALYVRVSTQDKGQDTENQKIQLERYARQQGWKIVRVYEDQASGTTTNRTAYQKMFEDASKGRFDVVLFWSLDRFSRAGTFETLNDLHRLGEMGIQFHSMQEPYLDTLGPFRDAILGLLAAIARMEHERIVARVKAGLERARMEGKRVGRPLSPVDAEMVVELRNRGLSLRKIAETLGCSVSVVVHRIRQASKERTMEQVRETDA